MKRIEMKNGDFIEIESLKGEHGIRVSLYDKMGYAKENKYYTDDEVLKMFGYNNGEKEQTK